MQDIEKAFELNKKGLISDEVLAEILNKLSNKKELTWEEKRQQLIEETEMKAALNASSVQNEVEREDVVLEQIVEEIPETTVLNDDVVDIQPVSGDVSSSTGEGVLESSDNVAWYSPEVLEQIRDMSNNSNDTHQVEPNQEVYDNIRRPEPDQKIKNKNKEIDPERLHRLALQKNTKKSLGLKTLVAGGTIAMAIATAGVGVFGGTVLGLGAIAGYHAIANKIKNGTFNNKNAFTNFVKDSVEKIMAIGKRLDGNVEEIGGRQR